MIVSSAEYHMIAMSLVRDYFIGQVKHYQILNRSGRHPDSRIILYQLVFACSNFHHSYPAANSLISVALSPPHCVSFNFAAQAALNNSESAVYSSELTSRSHAKEKST